MHEGCPKATRVPKSNVEFWTAKLLRNHERDVRQRAELEADGWKVIVVWECELGKKVRDERLNGFTAKSWTIPERRTIPGNDSRQAALYETW